MIELGLTDAALQGEWWRLWTAHFAHWNAAHLAANAVAAAVPLLAARPRVRLEMLVWGAAAAPLLSLLVLFLGPAGEMRGFSGIAAGWWVYAGLSLFRSDRAIGVLLIAALAAKLIAEALGLMPPHAGFVTLSILHYWAAALALLTVMAMTAVRKKMQAATRPIAALETA